MSSITISNDDDDDDEPVVTIRPLEQSDQADVARIWHDQSRKALPLFLEHWLMMNDDDMNSSTSIMVGASMSDTGDVGPDGTNLLQTYNGGNNKNQQDDRCMFVACAGEPPVVIGCCLCHQKGNGRDQSRTRQ